MFRADDAKVQGRLFPPAFNGIKDSQPGALSPWPWWRQIQPWANPYSFRSTLGKNTRACMHARIHTRIHTYTPTYMHACTTLHYVPLHYITIPYINLHYITLHTHIHTYIHTCIHTRSKWQPVKSTKCGSPTRFGCLLFHKGTSPRTSPAR